MSRRILRRRLDHVVATRGMVELELETAELLWNWGFDQLELTNEAKRLAIRCQQGGAVTIDDCVRIVAEDLGRTAEELQAEIESFLDGAVA